MPTRDIRTCFVTGGTGFIGSHLVEHLVRRGCRVRCLVRDPQRLRWLQGSPVDLIVGDLDSPDALREGASGVDAVFHLAGVTAAPSRENYHRVNAEGARRVGEAALEAAEPPEVFVYVSSLAAVGPSGRREAVSEGATPNPVTEYGRSKLAVERFLASLAPLPLVVTRPPAVYGPRDKEVFPLFRMAARGLFPIFNSAALISLIHVADLAEGIAAAAFKGRIGETYFLAHALPVPTGDFPVLFGEALGRKVRGVRVPGWVLSSAAAVSETWGRARGRMPVFNRDKVRELTAPGWVCSTAKAAKDLGFEAGTDVRKGLAATAAWYRDQGWL